MSDIQKIKSFLRAFKNDGIIFKTDWCGDYTEFYSEITYIAKDTLTVRINDLYPSPDCTDKNNAININFKDITNLEPRKQKIDISEIDGKILSIEWIKKNIPNLKGEELKFLDSIETKIKEFYSFELNKKAKGNQENYSIYRTDFEELFLSE